MVNDRVPAGVWKAIDNKRLKIIHMLCQKICETGRWPEDWSTSVLLPLHKKVSTSICDNYRLVALISHASKIMLYILQARLNAFLQHQMAPEQAGFVKGSKSSMLNT